MKILGWTIVVVWSIYTLITWYPVIGLPEAFLVHPANGLGALIAYVGLLILGIWLIRRKKRANDRPESD